MAEQSKDLQRRAVLTEDKYTSTLSMIIQRDYFPSLTDLQCKSALLERRLNNDIAGAVAIRRAARKLMNHEEALAEEEAKDEQDLNTAGIRKRARPLHQESLTGFHARATNEDDHDFHSQQKLEIQANRERLDTLFRPKEEIRMIEMSESASDQFEAESNQPTTIIPEVRNPLFFPPTPLIAGVKGESAGEIELLTNGFQGQSGKEQGIVMPPPRSKKPANKLSNNASKHALVEYIPKHSLEKKIEPSQTRFPTKILPSQSQRALLDFSTQQQQSDTDEWNTDASTDLDAPLRTLEEERCRRARKTAKDRQSYVAMTPLLVPGTGNNSPIMTWGTIDSTPLVLSGIQKPEETEEKSHASFSIAAENDRERAARKAEKELERRSKRAKTKTNRKRDKQSGSLTPSAMALLEKHKRTPSRQRDAFASALRTSYTPKSRSLHERVSSRKRRPSDNAFNVTPLASRSQR